MEMKTHYWTLMPSPSLVWVNPLIFSGDAGWWIERNGNNESWICALYSSYALNRFTSPFGPSKNPYHNSSTYSKLSSTLSISHISVKGFLPSVPTTDLQPAPTYPPLQLTRQGAACATTGLQQCASSYVRAAESHFTWNACCPSCP